MPGRRWWIVPLGLVGLLALLLAGRASAAEGRQGDECLVAADETVTTNLYVACVNLTVAGVIEGDLIGGAWAGLIAPGARVEGDVWLVGWQLRVDGTVGDDIHFAGVDLDVTDAADLQAPLDVSALALNVEVWEGATVPGDLSVFGYQAVVQGSVAQNVNFSGSALVVAGAVDGDVHAAVSGGEAIPFPFPFSVAFQPPGLTVQPGGQIAGNLTYSGPRPGNINGRIGGEINFDLDLPRPDITQTGVEAEAAQPLDVIGSYLHAVLTDVLSLMVAGVLVLLFAPNWLLEPTQILPRRLPASFGWGLVLTPLATGASLILILVSVLLLVVVSLITLGGFTAMGLVLLTMLNVVVIGGLTFIVLFLARLVVSMWIGRFVGRRLIRATDRWTVNLLSLLSGVLAYTLVANMPIPQAWLLINGLGICLGLGAVVIYARQLYRQMTASGATQSSPRPPVPPPDSAEPRGPGLDNLPPGFRWWESELEEEGP